MLTCLVVSTALRPQSKTSKLAQAIAGHLSAIGASPDFLDLACEPLPMCDGAMCYGHPGVQAVAQRVKQADGIILCSPVYNYQLNAAAKNFIELTNDGWANKVVGLVANASGDRSFLSVLSLANSLWVDHHCLIAPRFVYATGSAFAENGTLHPQGEIRDRMQMLVKDMKRLMTCLNSPLS